MIEANNSVKGVYELERNGLEVSLGESGPSVEE